ncbi:phage major capsid protein [Dermacoccaceae bacterium W4C1]
MALTTPTSAAAWRPDTIAPFNADDLVGDALIVQTASFCGTVEGDAPVVRVPFVSEDPDVSFVAEAAEITAAQPTLAEVLIATRKLATLVRVSREQITFPDAANRIAKSMQRAIVKQADVAYLTDPTAGLLNIEDVENAGTLGSDLFALTDAVGAIEADGGQATHVLVNPLDWAALAKIPAATGSNASLLGDAAAAPARQLLGLPVLTSAAVTAGTALVLDKSQVAAAYGQVQLARSEDAFFSSDSIGVRATWRIGWNVVRPARLRTLTIA